MISKEELKDRVFSSMTHDWTATTKIANKVGVHPSRVQVILIELFNEDSVEQLSAKMYTYWRIPKLNDKEVKHEIIKTKQANKTSC